MLLVASPGGVLLISSDGNERMKVKEKLPGPKINPKEIPCRISKPLKFPERINDISTV